MEDVAYKTALDDALSVTNGKRLLTMHDVRVLTGLVDSRTLRRHFPFGRDALLSVYQYAAVMAGGKR